MTIKVEESVCFSIGKTAEKTNQDAILSTKYVDNGVLLAVADGVGAYNGSELISRYAVNYLNNLKTASNVQDYLSVFNNIQHGIKELSLNDSLLEKASTTLTYCFIDNQNIYVGHIGDCRVYVKKQNKLIQISKDHTQHQYYLDQKIFTKSQLKNVKGKNVITTAISLIVDMTPEYYTFPLKDFVDSNGDVFIYIMSDGTHQYWEQNPRFSTNTMNSTIAMSSSLKRRIERKGPIDDYSLVACKLNTSLMGNQ